MVMETSNFMRAMSGVVVVQSLIQQGKLAKAADQADALVTVLKSDAKTKNYRDVITKIAVLAGQMRSTGNAPALSVIRSYETKWMDSAIAKECSGIMTLSVEESDLKAMESIPETTATKKDEKQELINFLNPKLIELDSLAAKVQHYDTYHENLPIYQAQIPIIRSVGNYIFKLEIELLLKIEEFSLNTLNTDLEQIFNRTVRDFNPDRITGADAGRISIATFFTKKLIEFLEEKSSKSEKTTPEASTAPKKESSKS